LRKSPLEIEGRRKKLKEKVGLKDRTLRRSLDPQGGVHVEEKGSI